VSGECGCCKAAPVVDGGRAELVVWEAGDRYRPGDRFRLMMGRLRAIGVAPCNGGVGVFMTAAWWRSGERGVVIVIKGA
jgi:hypothetical protein